MNEYVQIGRLRCRKLYEALLTIVEARSKSPSADPTCMSDVSLLSTKLKILLGIRPPLDNEKAPNNRLQAIGDKSPQPDP